MAALAFLLLLFSPSLLPLASGMGTIAYFYDVASGPSKAGVVASKVTADPGAGSPLGCTQLPLAPLSAKFNWNDSAGTWPCSYLVFYQDALCTPGKVPDSWIRASSTDASTTFDNFVAPSVPKVTDPGFNLPGITTAKSFRCATWRDQDPCHVLGCSDPGAQCYSLPNVVLTDPAFPNTTPTGFYSYKNCSTCLQAYLKNTTTGACDAKCSLHPPCPAGSTCEKATGKCLCPDTFIFDTTSWSCVDNTAKIWLGLLNPLRKTAGVGPLTWDTSLAAKALANAKSVTCVADPATPTLKRISQSSPKSFSENDAWQPNSLDESNFVDAWMLNTKASLRMTSASTTAVGCGKAYCGVGSLVTCLFSPFTA